MSKHYKTILELMKGTGGIVTASQVTEAGIPRRCLTEMGGDGTIYKVERGVYALPDAWEDEFFLMQYRFARGVFSHETALYLHSLTDRTPDRLTMTFPNGYNNSGVRTMHVVVRYSSADNYWLGLSEGASPAGHVIKVYDVERTLCDMLKPRYASDVHIVNHAMKQYLRSPDKDVAKLLEYAECCNVKSKILTYVEVLL